MATILRENISKLNDKLTVTLSKEDYMPSFEKSLKTYAKKANIPGFRKGMVPASVVKNMYGAGVYAEEVFRAVEKELNDYIKEHELQIFSQPLPLENGTPQLDMNHPADYAFTFEIGLMPDVDIDLKSITVTRHKVDVTEAMIDEEVQRLQNRFGKMTEPEEVTTEDNVLNVTFTETDAEGNEIEGGITKGNSLLVKYFTEDYRSRLMGRKKDDSILLQLDTAFDEKEKEWIAEDLGIAKTVDDSDNRYFKMLITKVGLVEKPEMNEEFFTQAIPGQEVNGIEEFRNAVKETIQAQWDLQSRNQLQDQIYIQLNDHTLLDFPEEFLKRLIREGDKEKKTAEEAEKEYPEFSKSLKWSLISNKFITQFGIDVEMPEIKQFAKQQVIGYMRGQLVDEEAPWLDSYADSMLKDKSFIKNTFQQLQMTKLFNLLEPQVNVIEDIVTPDELIAISKHHQH